MRERITRERITREGITREGLCIISLCHHEMPEFAKDTGLIDKAATAIIMFGMAAGPMPTYTCMEWVELNH